MDIKKLKALMGANDHSRKFIARLLGISVQGLRKKLTGKSEFKASELQELAKLYKKPLDYFFN